MHTKVHTHTQNNTYNYKYINLCFIPCSVSFPCSDQILRKFSSPHDILGRSNSEAVRRKHPRLPKLPNLSSRDTPCCITTRPWRPAVSATTSPPVMKEVSLNSFSLERSGAVAKPPLCSLEGYQWELSYSLGVLENTAEWILRSSVTPTSGLL